MENGEVGPSFSPGSVSDGLQVQDLGHLVLRGQAAWDGAQAQMGGKVAAAPVQLGQQHDGDKVERRGVDQERRGLPLGGREAALVGQRRRLRREWLLRVNLAVHLDHALHRPDGERLDLRQVGGGEGVGEVEEDHGAPRILAFTFSVIWRSVSAVMICRTPYSLARSRKL